jgi:hypothetical protein
MEWSGTVGMGTTREMDELYEIKRGRGEDIEERKRDIQKSSVIDQSEYPTNKSSYPAIQSRHMHPGISTVRQYSIYQPLFSLSLPPANGQANERGWTYGQSN